ncbi:MAG: PQQ-binding-like beta-propeller repeat protein, partial [Pirellulaceae bacterium]|nr:PQQ-binding-like beta-propeller repeat protein [Pirellulaceae bacterium]
VVDQQVVAQDQQLSFFRHDFGVPHDQVPLPDNFEQDATELWRTPLPPGHSSPCICGDSIFLTTYQAEEKELATVAIDRRSGAIRWRQVAPAKTIEAVHASGSPATSTPACNGRQVFSFFGSYGLLCYDLDGKLLWDRPLGPFQDEFGAASSPILVDDKVILNEDHDINSFLIAISQSSGEVVWKTPRSEATRSYSSPLVLERDGKKEILVAGSLQLAAYDPANGEKLWWFNGLSRIVDTTPVVHKGLVYVATWTPGGDPGERISMEPFTEALTKYDKDQNKAITQSELPKDSPVLDRFFRIDLNQNQQLEEDEWKRHASVFERAQNVAVALEPGTRGALAPQYVRWNYTRGLPTVPSSVVYDGTMTMVKDSGIITILDVENGKMLHQLRAEGRGNYFASLVAGDGKVYLTSEGGVVTILKSGTSGKIVGSHDFGQRIMASPVISQGVIYIRTEAALMAFSKAKPSVK